MEKKMYKPQRAITTATTPTTATTTSATIRKGKKIFVINL